MVVCFDIFQSREMANVVLFVLLELLRESSCRLSVVFVASWFLSASFCRLFVSYGRIVASFESRFLSFVFPMPSCCSNSVQEQSESVSGF